MKKYAYLAFAICPLVSAQALAELITSSGDGYTYTVGTPYANTNPNLTGGNGLSTASVWINSAVLANGGASNILGNNILHASNAAGIFTGNDQPDSLTGYALDGLLNGAAQQTGGAKQSDPLLNTTPTIFDGGAFITPNYLQDLDGDGEVDDPGWLTLYDTDGGFKIGGINDKDLLPNSFVLSDYMTINISSGSSKAGSWSINYSNPLGLLDALRHTAYGDSFFDHLAFTFKSGNQELIFFDFDFNLINDYFSSLGNAGFDLNQPYNLSGGFDLMESPGIGENGISHIALSVRDPNQNVPVPAPGPLVLIGAGILGLALTRRTLNQNL